MKKNIFYKILLTGTSLLFPLITFPYLSRILGAEGLGVCNFIMSYSQNYMTIAALGIPVYGIREIAKVGDDKEKRSRIFYELLAIHLIFTLLMLIIYSVSVILSDSFANYRQLALVGGSFIVMNVFAIEWLFSGVNDFKFITVRSIIIRFFSVIATFVFVKDKNDFSIYFILMVITTLLTCIVDIYYTRKLINRKIDLTWKGIASHIRPVIILGIYMVLVTIYAALPATLLGFMSTKASVSYYYASNRIIRMVISAFTAITTVMIPRVNLVHENKEGKEYLSLVNKGITVAITFGVPLAFFVFLMSAPLVLLLAGNQFTKSIFVTEVMSPIILIVALAQVFVLLVLSVNRQDKAMVALAVCGMMVSLAINIVFIPINAEKATAFSQLSAEFIVTLVAFILARRLVDFHFPLGFFLLNILLVIPFAGIAYLCIKTWHSNIIILLVSSIGCGIYFLIYQLFILKNHLIKSQLAPYLARVGLSLR